MQTLDEGELGSPGGLRERKKAKTRDALASAAMRLFSERGYEAVTIDEIAEAAEVSRRTFFRYFPNKESVLFPRRAERLRRFEALLEEGLAEHSGIRAIRHACLGIAEDYMACLPEVRAQHRLVLSSPTLRAHEQAIDRE
ncbi:MAG: TetR family transcriptional regulator, partial [Myxococcales bacterium]|nr:TetR family transcriptional regulator [Myxococcales bacterium]